MPEKPVVRHGFPLLQKTVSCNSSLMIFSSATCKSNQATSQWCSEPSLEVIKICM